MLLLSNATVQITRPSTGAVIYPSRRVSIEDPEDVMELFTPSGQQSDRVLTDSNNALWQDQDVLTILSQGGAVSSITEYTIITDKVGDAAFGLGVKIGRLRATRGTI